MVVDARTDKVIFLHHSAGKNPCFNLFAFSVSNSEANGWVFMLIAHGIVTLTMDDLSNMIMAGDLKQPVTTLKMTEDMQKRLRENHEKYLDEYCNLKELDFEQYRDEGGYEGEAQKRFQNRCVTVQELDCAGYTRSQIKHLYKLKVV